MIVFNKVLLKWYEPGFFAYSTFRVESWLTRLALLLVFPAIILLSSVAIGSVNWVALAVSILIGILCLMAWDSYRVVFITDIDVRVGPAVTTDSLAAISLALGTIASCELYSQGAHQLAQKHPVVVFTSKYSKDRFIGLPDEKTLNAVAMVLRWEGVDVVIKDA